MDSLQAATELMKPGCFMASIDLKDAYYTVPIHHEFQKCLKFQVDGKLINTLACLMAFRVPLACLQNL